MGSSAEVLVIVFIICAQQRAIGLATPCSSKNQTATGSTNERCGGLIIPEGSGEFTDKGDNSEEVSGIASHTIYAIVVVVGVVLIPVTVLTRICWLRKLQRQRNNAVIEVRQMVNQRFQEEHQRRRGDGIFSIDLLNIPFEDIFGKPPSYEESIANPCTGCPPPYDHPPCYKQDFDENENLTRDILGQQDPAPSSSSNVTQDILGQQDPAPSNSSNT